MNTWLRRSTDGRHIEEGKQQQAHLRGDTQAERRQALPLRSSSSIVVLALSVDSWRNVKGSLWITFRLDTGQLHSWHHTTANRNKSYYLVSVHWVVYHGSLWLLKDWKGVNKHYYLYMKSKLNSRIMAVYKTQHAWNCKWFYFQVLRKIYTVYTNY